MSLTEREELELLTLLEIEQREEFREAAEGSLSAYIKQAWPVIEPGTEYLHNWHIDAISEHLEAVTAGDIKRLLINMPPRYMKSICVSVMWPTWEWIRRPENRWMFASYSASLSTKHSIDRRTIIQSDWYRGNWSEVYQLTSDQNVKTEYVNNKRGVMFATSIGASSIGKGGNRIIVDDPHNPQEAQSDVQRESAVTFFDQGLYTRLDDKKQGAIVVVMQRLNAGDLSGHLLGHGNYTHLCLPAEAEAKTVMVMPISGREIIREPGELLWPEREGPDEIADQKINLGSYGYAGQYQQRPSPAEGGIVKRQWWRYYHHLNDEEGNPIKWDDIIQSWDMSFKDLKDSDFVVGQVWAAKGADRYLLDQVRGRWDFTATIAQVKNLTAKWPKATTKLIEDKANGPAIISALKHEVTGLIPVQVSDSKIARAYSVSPIIEAGNVYLPAPEIAPWVEDFVEEWVAFPNGANDDQVDASDQALNRLKKRRIQVF